LIEHQIRLGVSLDGPAPLHDAYRITRNGRGSHAPAMRGIGRLKERGIPFHVIAVVSEETARQGDAFIDFMSTLGAVEIGINFEELEGANGVTSLAPSGVSMAMRAFLERLVDHAASDPGLNLREMRSLVTRLRDPRFRERRRNAENGPFSIVTISAEGDLFSYSPELAGITNPEFGDFRLGNILTDTLDDMLDGPVCQRMEAAIARGVSRCERHCAYFDLCLGGAPSNKIAETGRFDVTETISCRHSAQMMSEIVLNRLERDLKSGTGAGIRAPVPAPV
ncbi:MAG: GRRM system radical SAM/SPASM domain protein, partial [Pseudomonadota bacterium]